MIDAIIFVVVLLFFAVGAVAGHHAARSVSVDVACACGAVRHRLFSVSVADATRFEQALTAGCPCGRIALMSPNPQSTIRNPRSAAPNPQSAIHNPKSNKEPAPC